MQVRFKARETSLLQEVTSRQQLGEADAIIEQLEHQNNNYYSNTTAVSIGFASTSLHDHEPRPIRAFPVAYKPYALSN